MVDFNNENTIGTPAADVEKITILQRRFELLEAYEDYNKKKFNGIDPSISFVKSRLITFFLEVQAMLERRLTKEEFSNIKETCFTPKFQEDNFLDIFYKINIELDKIQLIKIDNREVYNRRRVEEENRIKGY